ncbi:MAG TPA: Hsp20/alpha crystallin family protein, partial [Bacteroidia bacterium]|nr:Hsp20/alpha crystallin family protein [Bacteroidia bacterium]
YNLATISQNNIAFILQQLSYKLKDKIDVKATKNSVEISGEQSEKAEEKKKNYLYKERSYRSFHRRIPIPDEVLPSKIDAKMNNGILQIQLPKKIPTKAEEETTKVEIK